MQFIFDTLGIFVGGPANAFVIVAALIKIAIILGGLLQVIPFIILFERKIISWVQNRPGPNRAGPWGLLQGILDGVKLFFKEEITPKGVDKPLYLLAPALVVIPAYLAVCLIPVGPIIEGRHLDMLAGLLGLDPVMIGSTGEINQVALAITNPNVGILYVLAITSVGVYGVTIAGWSSNNKWSLLGGIRASAQMVSYEITLSLAIIGVILFSGSLNLYDIIDSQSGGFWNWNIVALPVAFIMFVLAMFAETNRLPFDLAEAEPELTGGFHTEYSSMRFALFFLGEYVNMVIVSAMCATLFLGGFNGLVSMDILLPASLLGTEASGWAGLEQFLGPAGFVAILGYYLTGPMIIMPAKIGFFIFLFIWARATLPRLRYDQLMNLGWKRLLPMGIINFVITAVIVGISLSLKAGASKETADWIQLGAKWVNGAITLSLFLAYDFLVFSPKRKKELASSYRLLNPAEESKSALAS